MLSVMIGSICRAGRLACLGGVLVIAYLSLVPDDLRPHVMASGGAEHFLAYFGEAALVASSFRCRRSVIWWHLGLCLLAGACEIAQTYIPGRGPGWEEFLAGSAGVGAAFGLFWLLGLYWCPEGSARKRVALRYSSGFGRTGSCFGAMSD